MTITERRNNTDLTLYLEGRLDISSFKDFHASLTGRLDGIECLTIDMERLEYISSAGLRSLLINQKMMNKQGKMIVRNANKTVMKAFQVTGLQKILTIE